MSVMNTESGVGEMLSAELLSLGDEARSGAAEGEKRDLRRDPDADGRADGPQAAIDVEARLERRLVTRG